MSMWFHNKGKTYGKGQIADIDPKYFDPSCMVKIEESKPVENLVQQTVVLMEGTKSESASTEDARCVSDKIKEGSCCGNAE